MYFHFALLIVTAVQRVRWLTSLTIVIGITTSPAISSTLLSRLTVEALDSRGASSGIQSRAILAFSRPSIRLTLPSELISPCSVCYRWLCLLVYVSLPSLSFTATRRPISSMVPDLTYFRLFFFTPPFWLCFSFLFSTLSLAWKRGVLARRHWLLLLVECLAA